MEALDYLHDLVPMNTTSSRSNLPAADYVEEVLKRLDFETERIEYDDANGVRKASIVGKRGEGQGGMAYFGHTDTVPCRHLVHRRSRTLRADHQGGTASSGAAPAT